MSITLAGLSLPDGCLWASEFDYVPVAATVGRTATGRRIVRETALVAGRPIDLGGDAAWITRADVLTLAGWAGTVGWTGRLTLHDGRTFAVRFRTQEEKAVEVAAVQDLADPGDDALYQLTALRLETV